MMGMEVGGFFCGDREKKSRMKKKDGEGENVRKGEGRRMGKNIRRERKELRK